VDIDRDNSPDKVEHVGKEGKGIAVFQADFAQAGGVARRHREVLLGRSARAGIVEDDRFPVGGQADVELDQVGAVGHREEERLEGVLQGAGRSPPVRRDDGIGPPSREKEFFHTSKIPYPGI